MDKVERDRIEATTPEQIMYPEDLAMLSPAAIRLFCGLWRIMAERQQSAVRLPDETASIRGRVLMKDLQDAKDELVRVGLLTILSTEKKDVMSYQYNEDHFTTDIQD
jgi:hypothetical protein